MGAYTYSTTAASNTSIDGLGNNGAVDPPSNIDNLVGRLAAAQAAFVRDLGGANTVAGTADAITVSLADPSTASAYFDGMVLSFRAASDTTSTAPTLNVDSIGAKTIKRAIAGVESALVAGDIQAGGTYTVVYRSAWATAAGAFELLNPETHAPTNLMAGNGTPLTYTSGFVPAIQSNQTGANGYGVSRFSANSNGPLYAGLKSRNATIGSHTVVQDGDQLVRLSGYGSDGTAGILGGEVRVEVDGTPGTNDMPGRIVFATTSDGASSVTSRWTIDSSGHWKPAANATYDIGTTSLGLRAVYLSNAAGGIYFTSGDATIYNSTNDLYLGSPTIGATVIVGSGGLVPNTDDGPSLGTTSLKWSDLFLGSGGVINWNNGTAAITESGGQIRLTNAVSGVFLSAGTGAWAPITDDGSPLGGAANKWSDLFLASGAVINFNSGDVTITHGTDALTFAGGTSGYTFNTGGIVAGAPTGGNKGAGTINATAVYDDNTLLTCYIGDVVDRATGEPIAFNIEAARKKWDDIAGGKHFGANKFFDRIGTEYDPRDIEGAMAHFRDKGHMTNMPNPDGWQASSLSAGEWVQRLVEQAELSLVWAYREHKRADALEARIAALEAQLGGK